MSRPTPAGSPSTTTAPRLGSGRHRLGRPTGVRCADLPAVRERLQTNRPGVQHRNAFLRWLVSGAPTGRHTWGFLASSGGRPRAAFAVILSL